LSIAEAKCIAIRIDLRAGLNEENIFFLGNVPLPLAIRWNAFHD